MSSLDFIENHNLAALTTIGIGGPARYFMAAKKVDEVIAGLRWAQDRQLPVSFLGGGSNVLFADEGWPGLVIHLQMRGWDAQQKDETVRISAHAGEPWDDFVAATVERGWAGIECLSGIPGQVGATPIQNVGAYGQEVAQTIDWVEVLDLFSFTTKRLKSESCQFGYRTSAFKTNQADPLLVVAVGFTLRANGESIIGYPDLQRRLSDNGNLAEVRRTVLQIRREKAMVVEASEPNSRSCGSFFTNPILDQQAYAQFKKRVPREHPKYPMDSGHVKLPAAWLIEQAGFSKGYCYKQVGLSQKHCLAIINRGDGTAAQVLELVAIIRGEVARQFGVILWPEPVLWSPLGKRRQLSEFP